MVRAVVVLLLALGLCAALPRILLADTPPQDREYWIKAEEILWDYAPSYPENAMTGEPFDSEAQVFLAPGPDRIGRLYRKAVYRQYTPEFEQILDGPHGVIDPTTGEQEQIRQPGSPQQHLGILGPILRAEVGDTLVIHFQNEASFPTSLHPHGVFYTKGNEGTPYRDNSDPEQRLDDVIAPGESFTYIWQVPERAGPGPNDPSSILWPYHSHVDEVGDTNAGLVGPILIHQRGELDPETGRAPGVDREFVSLFSVMDENSSSLLQANLQGLVDGEDLDLEDEEFVESNLMHGINGLLWSNLQGLRMDQGDRVRWYLLAMGTEVDIHTPHWHGATLLHNGQRVDITEIFPASAKTLDMIADVPGTWMYHCHVNDHLLAGMGTVFTVKGSGA